MLAAAAVDLQAQTLPITSGLQLWLNADVGITTNASGQITAWADQSGLGNNATQPTVGSAPIIAPASLNGHATVRVTGSQYMEVQNANGIDNLLDDVSILIVVKYDNLSSYRGVVSKCTGGVGSPFDFWSNASANGGRTSFYLGNGNGNGTAATLSTIPPPVGSFNVLSFRWKEGISSQFLNDFSIGVAPNPTVTVNGATNLRIGRRQDGTVQLVGNVAEILIYKPALSDADIYNVVQTYLQPKYALSFDAAPLATIASPANASTLPANTSIPVTVNASDSDGWPATVTLFANGVSMGTGTAVTTNSSSTFNFNVGAAFPGQLTLSAVVTDNYGRSSTSAPVLVNISGTAASSPVAAGLKTWLSADAGVATNATGAVTNWADQSGNANDAVQLDENSAPALQANAANGKPVVRFNGTPQWLEVSDQGTSFLTNDFSTFAVARFSGSFPALRQNVWSKSSDAGVAGPVDWWFNTGTGVPFGYRGDGVTFAGAGSGSLGPVLNQVAVVGMEVTGSNGIMAHFLGSVSNGASVALTNTANAGFPLRIGRRADGGTQINGDIAEILLYDRVLTEDERTNVTSYLAAKYNAIQPYNATPPPTITITSPTPGTLPAPSTVTLSATASSANGVITRVTLLANGQTYATLTNAPYQVRLDLLTPGTVTFSAVALDNFGVQTTATPVTLTITGTAAAPPLTNGLKTWLAADLGVTTNTAGAVTSWVDQSANGNDAAAVDETTSPSLIPNVMNGKPVLRFNGNNQFLEVGAGNAGFTAGDISTFAIVKINNYSTFRTIWSKTSANRPAPVDWYFASGSGNANVYRGDGPNIGNVVGSAPQAGAVVVVGFKAAGQAISQYIGYAVTGSGNITANVADAGLPLRIGRRADGATQMNGDIGEILIYDHAVSDAERLQAVNYLYNKWGITVVQVANVPPTISITSPTNGATASAPGVLGVSAQVTDPDSPINRVDFFANGLLVATRTSAPYQIPLDLLSPGSLRLEARATDFWGALGTSAPVVINIIGTSPANPPAVGRVLWLKADAGVTTNADGTVATWADQSGNANDAAQDSLVGNPSPVLITDAAGRQMLNYDGTLRYLKAPHSDSLSVTNDMSFFCAVNVDDFAAIRTIASKGNLANPHPFDYFFTTAGLAQVNRGDNRGTSAAVSSSPIPTGTNVITGFTVDGSTGTHYFQGLPNGTGQFGYGTIDDGTSLYIGARDDFNVMFKGNIGELMIYDHALQGSELQTVNAYLAGRYGVAAAQFSTTPPTLTAKAGTGTLQLSYPTGYVGFVVEGRTNIASGAWVPIVTNPPNNQITLGTTNAVRFFRLRSQ